jgi:MYXO-CTERM domain-containing protein
MLRAPFLAVTFIVAASLSLPHDADAAACMSWWVPTPWAHPAPSIPANAGGIWAYTVTHGDYEGRTPDELVLSMSSSEGDVALDVEWVDRSLPRYGRTAIRTSVPLIAGETLTLTDFGSECATCDPWCDLCAEPSAPSEPKEIGTWLIGPAVPMPTSLGILDVTIDRNGSLTVPSEGFLCMETYSAPIARFSLVPDAAAEPWLDVVVYETWIDGELYEPIRREGHGPPRGADFDVDFGGSWMGRGQDVAFVTCDESPSFLYLGSALPSGEHTVVMRAILPDGTVVETAPETFTLACNKSGGCAAGANSTWALALVAALILVGRRRRRRGADRVRLIQPALPSCIGSASGTSS